VWALRAVWAVRGAEARGDGGGSGVGAANGVPERGGDGGVLARDGDGGGAQVAQQRQEPHVSAALGGDASGWPPKTWRGGNGRTFHASNKIIILF